MSQILEIQDNRNSLGEDITRTLDLTHVVSICYTHSLNLESKHGTDVWLAGSMLPIFIDQDPLFLMDQHKNLTNVVEIEEVVRSLGKNYTQTRTVNLNLVSAIVERTGSAIIQTKFGKKHLIDTDVEALIRLHLDSRLD